MITNNDIQSLRQSLSHPDSTADEDMKIEAMQDLAEQLLKERDFESESNIANMKKISDLISERDSYLEQLKAVLTSPDWDEVSRRNKEIIQLREQLKAAELRVEALGRLYFPAHRKQCEHRTNFGCEIEVEDLAARIMKEKRDA